MKKKISIIIPHYQEQEEVVLPLLESIDTQIGVDFGQIEVILVSDGPDAYQIFADKRFKSYPFKFDFKVITNEKNGGPGLARQCGIDHASGQYAVFCDCDDVIHNVGVLEYFMNEIDATHPVLLTTRWLEELILDERQYICHGHDLTWMHGKMVDLTYIKKHNIRFHPDLRIHEDSYFLSVLHAHCCDEGVRHGDVITYVWKYYKNTITRKDDAAYTYTSFAEFLRAIGLSLAEAERLNKSELIKEKIVQIICYTYYLTQAPDWVGKDNIKEDIIESLKNNVLYPYQSYWQDVSAAVFYRLYKEEQRKHGNYIEVCTLGQWLRENKIPLKWQ